MLGQAQTLSQEKVQRHADLTKERWKDVYLRARELGIRLTGLSEYQHPALTTWESVINQVIDLEENPKETVPFGYWKP